MPAHHAQPETFGEFKNPFSYGARTDLNFRFLKGLPDEAAAEFLQELLWKLGDTLGRPRDARGQSRVVRAALNLLEEAGSGGTIVEL